MSELEFKALKWLEARSAMVNMAINEPDYKRYLNELSEAENNLAEEIRAYKKYLAFP